MRQNMANVHLTAIKVDGGYEAIFIAYNIKHYPIPNFICRGKDRAQFTKIANLSVLYNLIPTCQRCLAVMLAVSYSTDSLSEVSMRTTETPLSGSSLFSPLPYLWGGMSFA